MGLKETLSTLDIDTVLDIMGHGIGADNREILLARVPKELIISRINDHGGIEI